MEVRNAYEAGLALLRALGLTRFGEATVQVVDGEITVVRRPGCSSIPIASSRCQPRS